MHISNGKVVKFKKEDNHAPNARCKQVVDAFTQIKLKAAITLATLATTQQIIM